MPNDSYNIIATKLIKRLMEKAFINQHHVSAKNNDYKYQYTWTLE